MICVPFFKKTHEASRLKWADKLRVWGAGEAATRYLLPLEDKSSLLNRNLSIYLDVVSNSVECWMVSLDFLQYIVDVWSGLLAVARRDFFCNQR